MTTLRRILTASALAVMATGLATADTIITGNLTSVQTVSAGPTTFNYGNGAPQPDVPLAFNEFDPNACATATSSTTPCTLTSIHFTIGTTVVANYSVTNTSGSTAKFAVTSAAIVDVGDQFDANFTYSEALPSKSGNTGNIANGATKTGSLTATGSGSADYTCPSGSLTGSTGGSASDPIVCATFVGSGTVNLFAIGNFTGSIGGTGFSGTIGGTGSETVTVQYDYSYTIPSSSTPEPFTMSLMGGALLAVGLVRRRSIKR